MSAAITNSPPAKGEYPEGGRGFFPPKLRFPEFEGGLVWEMRKIGSMLAETPRPIELEDEADYCLVTVRRRYGGLVSRGILKGKEIKVSTQFLVRAGDFLISKRQIVHDACGIVSPELDGAVVSNEYSVLTAREGCSVEFIHWFAQQPCVSASFLECSVGIVIEKMLFKLNLWLKREFLFPTLLEQQKIAACLSSLDELIAAQARKVEALKIHKKGLMQQLFPCEGESQPRVRFPEFGNDEQWGNVSLGEISEIKLGKMLDKQKNTTGYLLPYLNNISVRWNEVNVLDLPQMYFDDRELERFGLKSGDVVVCEGGEPGRAAVWDGHLPDLKFQKAIHRVRFNVPFEPKILVLLLESFSGTPQFEMLFTGGGIKHLTGETFSRLKIPLISLPEQKRIADCFTSLDELITAATQELETLKTHKKGLMQQLFPAMDEMSA